MLPAATPTRWPPSHSRERALIVGPVKLTWRDAKKILEASRRSASRSSRRRWKSSRHQPWNIMTWWSLSRHRHASTRSRGNFFRLFSTECGARGADLASKSRGSKPQELGSIKNVPSLKLRISTIIYSLNRNQCIIRWRKTVNIADFSAVFIAYQSVIYELYFR